MSKDSETTPGPEIGLGRRNGFTSVLYRLLPIGSEAAVSGAKIAGKIVVPSKGEIPETSATWKVSHKP